MAEHRVVVTEDVANSVCNQAWCPTTSEGGVLSSQQISTDPAGLAKLAQALIGLRRNTTGRGSANTQSWWLAE